MSNRRGHTVWGADLFLLPYIKETKMKVTFMCHEKCKSNDMSATNPSSCYEHGVFFYPHTPAA